MNLLKQKLPLDYLSSYNLSIEIAQEHLDKVNQDFLQKKVSDFFNALNIKYGFGYLDQKFLITEKEFENIQTELARSYFYEYLFANIKKNDRGQIQNHILFTLTFDRDLAPFRINNINYGVITLGQKPIFYYLFIDLQELIRYIKKL